MTQSTLFPELTNTPEASRPSTFASAFDHFTLDQRKQIIAWNERHTYDETIDLIQKHFGVTVSRSALGRFHARTAFIRHIDESPDTQAAADEILLHITDKNHLYTAASLHVLEQTAFKLALTCADQSSHLDLLTRLNTIICRARNTLVRERQATVQETKCDLRREELALKTKLTHHRLTLSREHLELTKHRLLSFNTKPSLCQNDSHHFDQTHRAGPALNDTDVACDSAESDRLPISISPCPLPPEVREENALYAKKLRVGEVKHIFAPGELAHTQYCNPADKPYFAREEATGTATFVPDPARTTYLRALKVVGQIEASLPNTTPPATTLASELNEPPPDRSLSTNHV